MNGNENECWIIFFLPFCCFFFYFVWKNCVWSATNAGRNADADNRDEPPTLVHNSNERYKFIMTFAFAMIFQRAWRFLQEWCKFCKLQTSLCAVALQKLNCIMKLKIKIEYKHCFFVCAAFCSKLFIENWVMQFHLNCTSAPSSQFNYLPIRNVQVQTTTNWRW